MADCNTLSCQLGQVRKACGTLREMEHEALNLEDEIGRRAASALGKARDSCKTAVERLESREPLGAVKHVRAIGRHLRQASSAITR